MTGKGCRPEPVSDLIRGRHDEEKAPAVRILQGLSCTVILAEARIQTPGGQVVRGNFILDAGIRRHDGETMPAFFLLWPRIRSGKGLSRRTEKFGKF